MFDVSIFQVMKINMTRVTYPKKVKSILLVVTIGRLFSIATIYPLITFHIPIKQYIYLFICIYTRMCTRTCAHVHARSCVRAYTTIMLVIIMSETYHYYDVPIELKGAEATY